MTRYNYEYIPTTLVEINSELMGTHILLILFPPFIQRLKAKYHSSDFIKTDYF